MNGEASVKSIEMLCVQGNEKSMEMLCIQGSKGEANMKHEEHRDVIPTMQ